MIKLSDKLKIKEEKRLRDDIATMNASGFSKQSISKYLEFEATKLYGLNDIPAEDVGVTGYGIVVGKNRI